LPQDKNARFDESMKMTANEGFKKLLELDLVAAMGLHRKFAATKA